VGSEKNIKDWKKAPRLEGNGQGKKVVTDTSLINPVFGK